MSDIKLVIEEMATLALRCHGVLPDFWEAGHDELLTSVSREPKKSLKDVTLAHTLAYTKLNFASPAVAT